MEKHSLDIFLEKFVQRNYNRYVTVFNKRLTDAHDKEYTLNQYCKRIEAYGFLRQEINDDYRWLIESLDKDYRLGRPFYTSVNRLRRINKKTVERFSKEPDFVAIIKPEKADGDTEEIAINNKPPLDLSTMPDIEIVRIFGLYKTYQKFFEYLKGYKLEPLNGLSETVSEIREPLTDKVKEFTTARQVLAMHYLFQYCKVKNIDMTEKARFIHFLTGKNFDNIYKKVQSPLSGSDKVMKEDLRFVRGYFEKLGLPEVVKMISNEINI